MANSGRSKNQQAHQYYNHNTCYHPHLQLTQKPRADVERVAPSHLLTKVGHILVINALYALAKDVGGHLREARQRVERVLHLQATTDTASDRLASLLVMISTTCDQIRKGYM